MRVLAFVIILGCAAPTLAGSDVAVDWYTMAASGSITSTGGAWTLKGTLGQAEATGNGELEGGEWQLTGGFWGLVAEVVDRMFHDRFEGS